MMNAPSLRSVPGGARQFTIIEPDEAVSVLPGVDFRAVPSKVGSFCASVATVELGDITLQTGHCSPILGMASVLPAGKAVLQILYAGLEGCILNGRSPAPGDFTLYGEGGGLQRVSMQETRHIAICIPVERMGELLLSHAGFPGLRAGAQDRHHASRPAWDRMVDIGRSAYETVLITPDVFDGEEARRAVRSSLLRATSDLMEGCEKRDLDAPPRRSSEKRRRIISAVDDYLRSDASRPVYTEDLCAALGTSASCIADAFRATFGITPHRFLKMRRLAMVRTAIRASEMYGGASLVKSIALSHGFWHLGQFAHDYRAMYGESPSETRNRFGVHPTEH